MPRRKMFNDTFGAASSINIGDPYVDRKNDRGHGNSKGKAQFGTAPTTKGPIMKFPRLFDGEMYVSAAQRRMREKKAAREKNVGEKPFVPPSPSKKMTSAGTLSGTFTNKIEYIPRPEVASDRKGAHGQKQILTNPPKKGHYNTPGILMSKQAYMPADYGSFQRQEAERRRKYYEENKDKKGWSPAGILDTKANKDNTVYFRDEKCLPPSADPYESMSRKERVHAKKAKDKYERKAYCPTSKEAKGITAGFSKFPKWKPRKPIEATRKDPEEEEAKVSMRPVGGGGTGPTRSIAKMNITAKYKASHR